jgi:hypothetical protein
MSGELRNVFKFPSVTVSGLMTAPCEKLFAIVTDVTRHPELAGSGEVQQVEWITAAPHGVGSGFASRQRVGVFGYPTRSYVQVYDAPRQFVWLSGPGAKRPPLGQLWGFDFKRIDARTTWVSHMMRLPLYPVLNVPPFSWLADAGATYEAANMKPTLRKLARMADAQLLGELKVVLDWCVSDAPCSQIDGALRAA